MYDYHARHLITLSISCLLLYQAQNETEIMGVRLLTTHLFDKCIRVSNACNTDFRLFMILGEEMLIHCIYLALYLGHT